MTVFAISDLHLPANDNKPMDVFGAQWERHFERIQADWCARVTADDIVLLPGDISWAMRLEDAASDLRAIAALPGHKVMIRGNHDYWWSSISRVREQLPPGTYALQNDSLLLNGVLIAGTRGWILPGEGVAEEDEKIYHRECLRLNMSLASARRKDEHAPLICMMHYPPLTENMKDTGFTQLMQQYRVDHAPYGHLHGASLYGAFRGALHGVAYHPVSCDGLDFKLLELMTWPQ